MNVISCFRRCLATLALLVLWIWQTQASVMISLDDVTVPAGSTALVGVYATSDQGDVMSGFNLPFDINNDGYVDATGDGTSDLPAGFSLNSPPMINMIYANAGFDLPQPQIVLIGVDGIPTGSGADANLSGIRTKLFDLSLHVDAAAVPGTRLPLSIIVPNAPFQALFNIAGTNSPTVAAPVVGQPVEGSITVALPEPSVVSLSAILVGLLFRRRFAARP